MTDTHTDNNDGLTYLLEQLEKSSDLDKVLGRLAIYYIHNPDGDKDLYYLKKAYENNPTIKNSINYAYQAWQEYGEYQLARNIMQSIVDKNPNHYYPYALYSQILLEDSYIDNPLTISKDNHQKIIELSRTALDKFATLDIKKQHKEHDKKIYLINNLIISLASTGQFHKIKELYDNLYQEIEFSYKYSEELNYDTNVIDEWHERILSNHAYISIINNDKTSAYHCLNKIRQLNYFDKFDTAQAYAMLGNRNKCIELIKNGIDTIHIDWDILWYEIFKINPGLWRNKIKSEIDKYQSWIAEEKITLECCQDNKERQNLIESIQNYQDNINHYERLLSQNKPDLLNDKPESYLRYFYGCYLIGCQVHDNCFDDEFDNKFI